MSMALGVRILATAATIVAKNAGNRKDQKALDVDMIEEREEESPAQKGGRRGPELKSWGGESRRLSGKLFVELLTAPVNGREYGHVVSGDGVCPSPEGFCL
jgi:hypothetical protein